MGKNQRGKELGEGICQRADGRYMARYTDRFGKRKTIYGKTYKEVRRELDIARANNFQLKNVRDDTSLETWFTQWMEVYKKKRIRSTSYMEYMLIWNKNIEPHIGHVKLRDLRKIDVQRVIDIAVDDGYGYERQNKIKVMLNDMMERAVEDDMAVKNPCRGIIIRSQKEIKAEALTIQEQSDFFEQARNTFYENLFMVAVNTGLRPGELFALYPEDIDFREGVIHVTKTLIYQKYPDDEGKTFHIEAPKTRQSIRDVPINSVCEKYLRLQLAQKKSVSSKNKLKTRYLFTTKRNTPLNSQLYSQAIRSVVNAYNAGKSDGDRLKRFSGHTFRHTFATRCFEAGIDAKTVQKYLGHASIKMTMDLYTHVTKEKASKDIERIASVCV